MAYIKSLSNWVLLILLFMHTSQALQFDWNLQTVIDNTDLSTSPPAAESEQTAVKTFISEIGNITSINVVTLPSYIDMLN
jgi:hypothetical protein